MNGVPTSVQAVEGVGHKYNYDNIFIRTTIAGVINILNDRVFLTYQLSKPSHSSMQVQLEISLNRF